VNNEIGRVSYMPLCYTASRAILLCHIDYWLANVCRAYESLLIKYIIADLLICHCNVLIFMAFSRGALQTILYILRSLHGVILSGKH
jgi:hypothetical protein